MANTPDGNVSGYNVVPFSLPCHIVMTFPIMSLESRIVTYLYRCRIFYSDHKFVLFVENLLYHICQICAGRFVCRLLFMSNVHFSDICLAFY